MGFHVLTLIQIFSLIDNERKIDIISKVPEEVALMIFSMMDKDSLVMASQVCTQWMDIILSSCKLTAQLKAANKQFRDDKENKSSGFQKSRISLKRKRKQTECEAPRPSRKTSFISAIQKTYLYISMKNSLKSDNYKRRC
uniref:F-box domain-containing protein n=1 Tax=Rhodnius prolixus TaxID=13249 RepID=T1ICU3_RHOPR